MDVIRSDVYWTENRKQFVFCSNIRVVICQALKLIYRKYSSYDQKI